MKSAHNPGRRGLWAGLIGFNPYWLSHSTTKDEGGYVPMQRNMLIMRIILSRLPLVSCNAASNWEPATVVCCATDDHSAPEVNTANPLPVVVPLVERMASMVKGGGAGLRRAPSPASTAGDGEAACWRPAVDGPSSAGARSAPGTLVRQAGLAPVSSSWCNWCRRCWPWRNW